jgi:Orsellinic acid/F9775 biosynthesis cluster protein D
MSEQSIRYEPLFRVMICRLCQKGVSKNGVARHYREYHKALSLRVRRDLVKYSNNFDRCEPSEVQYPTTIVSSIQDLEIRQGIRCLYDNCYHAYLAQGSMEYHCGNAHDWTKSRGTAMRLLFLTLREGVMWIVCDVQILFQKYFPVRNTPLLDPEINAFLERELEADLGDLEARRKNIIVPETQSERIEPLFNRAGFLRILAGKNINELYPIEKCTCGCRD